MAYLRLKDYDRYIQSDQLSQIIGSDSSVRLLSEAAAISELKSYLVQKYDVDDEFRDTVQFSMATAYKAERLVYLDASTYAAATTYSVGDLVTSGGSVYVCIQAGTGQAPATATAYWTLIGDQYALYYVSLPHDMFDINETYEVGDQVFWKDKVYTCAIETSAITQQDALQYGSISSLPQRNVLPDDSVNGEDYWGSGVAYEVTAGTLPSNTAKWTAGDNRSQQLVMHAIDITLYHIHSRIAPRNIPQLRMDRYDAAIAWLKMANRGEITADIPKLQPKQGARIRYGGNVKSINRY